MLGYYQTESIPNPAMSMSAPAIAASLEAINPVKSLVCSPDIAMYAASKCNGTETAGDPASPTMMNGGKYQCLLCQESFAQKKVYQNHLRLHGKDGEDPYRCNICGKTFAVPARLTRHYRTHTGEKPYQCEYCSKSFSVKENLSVHRRIHTKERPYKCNVCGRAFEHSGKLHRHMRIHTGERPHKCAVCAKTFIQSGQLVIHMRTHTGEKPYVCKSCKKGFTCSKQLKVHMRTHTGEKPYTCDICRKAFGYNHVLKLHQVSHYGEKVYKCMICNETFNSKKTMELHIKKHPESPASSVTAGVTGNGLSSPAVLGSLIELDVEISQGGSGDGGGGDGGSGDGNKSSNGDDNRPSLRNNAGTVNVPTTNSNLPGIITDDKENLKTKEAYPDSTTPYTVQRELAYYLYSTNREQQQQYSQTDDKENLKTEEGNPDSTTPIPYTVQREFAYYLYSSNREQQQSQYSQPVTTPPVNTAAEPVPTDVDEKGFQASMVVSAPLESATCHVFFYPEPTYTSFGMATGGGINLDTDDCSSLLNLPGNDARRRVEAALEAVEEECQRQEYNVGIKVDRDPLLTPPGSNPESPLSSPDLALDLAIPSRETLILPLRKRSKMILQSMESEYRNNSLIATSQRQSSVIQFARASVKVL